MRVSYDLPNPFMFSPGVSAGANAAPVFSAPQHAERLPSSDAAGAGAAPYPAETEVMPHTVARSEQDDARRDNATPPSYEVGAAPGYQCCVDCGVREPCDRHCPHGRFQLDESALMSDIEPVPAFLMANLAEQVEELLELARVEDWPAPPQRMVG